MVILRFEQQKLIINKTSINESVLLIISFFSSNRSWKSSTTCNELLLGEFNLTCVVRSNNNNSSNNRRWNKLSSRIWRLLVIVNLIISIDPVVIVITRTLLYNTLLCTLYFVVVGRRRVVKYRRTFVPII